MCGWLATGSVYVYVRVGVGRWAVCVCMSVFCVCVYNVCCIDSFASPCLKDLAGRNGNVTLGKQLVKGHYGRKK